MKLREWAQENRRLELGLCDSVLISRQAGLISVMVLSMTTLKLLR